MKTYEFNTTVSPEGTVSLPGDIASEVSRSEAVRVILLVEDSSEDRDWQRLATEQFLNGYDEGDAIYDDLPTG
jgi:hypothetical protein